MSTRKRFCIFCEDRVGQLSLEHCPPQWIKHCFPEVTGAESFMVTESKKEHRGETATVTPQAAKIVCIPCNTGWMRDLENATRPVLEPLIVGTPTKLGWNKQVILSTWLIKAALTFAPMMDWEHATTFSAAYRAFYKQRKPSHDYEVMIAASSDKLSSELQIRAHIATENPPGVRQLHFFTFLIKIGRFVGTVAYRDPMIARLVTWPQNPFISIWPGSGIRVGWPPQPELTRQAIHEIGHGPDYQKAYK